VPISVAQEEQGELNFRDPTTIARLITDHAADGIFLLDDQGRTTFVNPAGEVMFGWSGEELEGLKLHDVIHHHHPDGRPFPMSECPLGNVFQTGQSLKAHEDVFFHRDGRKVPVACSNAAIIRDGLVVGGVLIASDMTKRVEAERRNQLLIDELGHRVKNTLSVVQAIADQSLRGPNFLEARRALSGRIRTLAAAHDLLAAGEGIAAPIREVVERTVRPFSFGDRISVGGPEIILPPRLATALSMAIHELGTNAVKYGALSNDSGTVEIVWQKSDQAHSQTFTLVWHERCGPEVKPPRSRGFGSRMIEKVLSAEAAGSARMDFHPEGLVCTLSAPLPN
jgi:PAS domain S-box-containing protein